MPGLFTAENFGSALWHLGTGTLRSERKPAVGVGIYGGRQPQRTINYLGENVVGVR